MSETTERQGRAPGLYDEQLQRQLQEKRVSQEEAREMRERDMPLFAGLFSAEKDKCPEHRAVEHGPASR